MARMIPDTVRKSTAALAEIDTRLSENKIDEHVATLLRAKRTEERRALMRKNLLQVVGSVVKLQLESYPADVSELIDTFPTEERTLAKDFLETFESSIDEYVEHLLKLHLGEASPPPNIKIEPDLEEEITFIRASGGTSSASASEATIRPREGTEANDDGYASKRPGSDPVNPPKRLKFTPKVPLSRPALQSETSTTAPLPNANTRSDASPKPKLAPKHALPSNSAFRGALSTQEAFDRLVAQIPRSADRAEVDHSYSSRPNTGDSRNNFQPWGQVSTAGPSSPSEPGKWPSQHGARPLTTKRPRFDDHVFASLSYSPPGPGERPSQQLSQPATAKSPPKGPKSAQKARRTERPALTGANMAVPYWCAGNTEREQIARQIWSERDREDMQNMRCYECRRASHLRCFRPFGDGDCAYCVSQNARCRMTKKG